MQDRGDLRKRFLDLGTSTQPCQPGTLEGDKQLPRFDFKRLRNPNDIHQRHVPFRPLDLADVVPVESRQLSEPLLREISLSPQFTESLAEEAEDLIAHSFHIWTCASGTLHLL